VTQLTSYFNPSPTADPRTRGSVRRVSGFVQISTALIEVSRPKKAKQKRKIVRRPDNDNHQIKSRLWEKNISVVFVAKPFSLSSLTWVV
jgi:hypothetical protein